MRRTMTRRTQMLRMRRPARDAVACDLIPDGCDQTQMLRIRRLSEVRRACARRDTGDGTAGLRACRVEPLRSSALGRFAFAPHAYPVAEIRQSLALGRFAFAVPRIMRGGEGKSNRPNPACDAVACDLFPDSRDQTQMLRMRRSSEVRRACARRDTGDGTAGLRVCRVEPLRSLVLGWFAFAPHAYPGAEIRQSLVYGRFAFAVPRMRGSEGKSNRPNPACDAVACDLIPDSRDQTQMLRIRRPARDAVACVSSLFVSFT